MILSLQKLTVRDFISGKSKVTRKLSEIVPTCSIRDDKDYTAKLLLFFFLRCNLTVYWDSLKCILLEYSHQDLLTNPNFTRQTLFFRLGFRFE